MTTEELVYRRIASPCGVIYKQYRESYNRDLNSEDVDNMIALIRLNKLQEVIDDYTVRKVTCGNINELILTCYKTQNLPFFKYYFRHISLHDKFLSLQYINNHNGFRHDNPITKYCEFHIDELNEDWIDSERINMKINND